MLLLFLSCFSLSSVSVLRNWWQKVFQEQPSLSKLAWKRLQDRRSTAIRFWCPFVQTEAELHSLCHSVSYFKKRIQRNDRQMSHSVKSYWLTAGIRDRARNCGFTLTPNVGSQWREKNSSWVAAIKARWTRAENGTFVSVQRKCQTTVLISQSHFSLSAETPINHQRIRDESESLLLSLEPQRCPWWMDEWMSERLIDTQA